MRIALFGDSFTNGTGDDTCLGWPGRVVAERRASGHDVTLYNLGVRGDTSADIRRRWRAEAEARLPEGVDGRLVFAFGANDGATADDGGPRVALAASLAHAEAVLVEAGAWLPTILVGPLPLGTPEEDARLGRLCRAYAALAARLGIPYCAVFEPIAASLRWRREVEAGDGSHPNAGGYAELASVIAASSAWRAWVDAPPAEPA